MSGEIEFLRTAIPVFLSIFVPGFLLALALLRKTKMPLAEIAVFGFIFGLIFPSVLLFIYQFFGILYSPQLVIANIVFVTVIGFLLCVRENALSFEVSFNYKRDAAWVLLLLIMLFAFWIRIQSIGPIFYEFDPYYYNQVTQFILTKGVVPVTDDLAWYPNLDSHRHPPLVSYLEVQWYAIHGYVTGSQEFDNYLLSTIAGAYPPVVGALICFLVFILISEGYGKKYGLVGAALMAIIPRAIEKFAAGESEFQPWGIFAAFLFYSTYALAISRKDKRFAILAGIAVMAATLGSTADVLIYLVVAGYVVAQSLVNYLKNKPSWDLLKVNAIIFCFAVFSWALFLVYTMSSNSEGKPHFELPSDVLGFASALAFAFGLQLLSQRVKTQEERINYIGGYLIAGAVLFLLTSSSLLPYQFAIGRRVLDYVNAAAAIARPSSALMMTVAEETPTSQEFASSIGFLGSSSESVSVILLLSFVAIIYSVYRGSELGVLFGMMIFPVSYVGLNKSKYMLHVSFMIGVAMVMMFGELDKLLRNFLKREFGNEATWGIFFAALLMLSAEMFVYPNTSVIGGPFLDVVGGILDSKYQLNETSSAGVIRNCNLLTEDLKPISSYLFCSRIPTYWRDSMDWIKENVGEEDRVISWWDYGHWINYWGEKKCVTRNDHKYQEMDLEVADKFVSNTPEALKAYMLEHKAKYVLFDQDLIGKWGALNFLSCVYNNGTNMSFAFKEGARLGSMYQLGTSPCEAEHQFERIFIPVSPTVNDICSGSDPTNPMLKAYTLSNYSYCVLFQTQGSKRIIADMLYENNLSRRNRGIPVYSGGQIFNGKEYETYTMLYTKDIWPDGQSGWEDRKGKMYDSNFYNGFILGELQGFEQVYPANNTSGLVRIYKIKD